MTTCTYAGCPRHATVTLDGWDFCDDCKVLHASEAIGAVPPPRAASASAPTYCGTVGGYREHLADDTEPCAPCDRANGDAMRSRRKRAKKKAAAAAHTDSATPADVCRVDGDLGTACWALDQGEGSKVQQAPGQVAA